MEALIKPVHVTKIALIETPAEFGGERFGQPRPAVGVLLVGLAEVGDGNGAHNPARFINSTG